MNRAMKSETTPISRSIGSILIDTGRISFKEADQIVRMQKEIPELRFGDAAVKLGLVSEDDIQRALADQFVYPYLDSSKDHHVSKEVIAAFEPANPMVEQLRAIRSQLLLHWFNGNLEQKTLAVVGAESGAGVSFVAANVAVVFSQLGYRTLLLDANMRSPRQHELFKLDNRIGFSAVLAGRIEWSQAVASIDGLRGLNVLQAGATPPNPQELLCRPGYVRLIDSLKAHYDIIIMDTPSGELCSDALSIALQAKGVFCVAAKNRTSTQKIQSFAGKLADTGATLVGSMLNKA